MVPGRRYCFNGWAYNSCGAGPVFTLEGVCVRNLPHCKDAKSTGGRGDKSGNNNNNKDAEITTTTPMPDVEFDDDFEHRRRFLDDHCELDFDYGLN